MRFNHVVIVGVGLIGGSFALALRRGRLAGRITAWGGSRSIERAAATGVIDGIEESFDSGRESTGDLVYLAAPVASIIDFLKVRGKLIKPGAIVTDAGSTKREICAAAREGLPRGVHFVGGHPMAGSHRTGVEFARPDLFAGAPYAIVPGEVGDTSGSPGAVDLIISLVAAIGARPILMLAGEHDRTVARISHVPQLLSTLLALAVAKSDERRRLLEFAGTGFSDMTRLAESSWSIWEDICRTNGGEIAAALSNIAREIEAARQALESGDFGAISEAFRIANECAAELKELRARSNGRVE